MGSRLKSSIARSKRDGPWRSYVAARSDITEDLLLDHLLGIGGSLGMAGDIGQISGTTMTNDRKRR